MPHLLATLVFLASLAYFTGSKNNVLTLVVAATLYYEFCVRPIPKFAYLLIALFLFLGVLALLVAHSAFERYSESFLYFGEYMNTTAWFLSRFDEFGYYYGEGWLSNFWFYVPRGLYPDKPYEYGFTIIHGVLYPGMAATGNTPGLQNWSLAYLDFGALGVFLFGFTSALWQRIPYEHFLRNRRSFFSFVFMAQFSLWPVFTFAPLVILLVWSIAQSLFLRIRIRSG